MRALVSRPISLSIVAAIAPTLASAQAIDAKPGLWEHTAVMRQASMPPMPDLSKLPPEQRAQMQTMIDQMSGKPVVQRRCVTAESLKSWERYARQAQEESSCRYTILESNPKRVRMTMTCESNQTTGSMEWSVPTPESMQGSFDITSTRKGAERRMSATMSGRWLGADCGDVLPD
jgi:hypothetical protein